MHSAIPTQANAPACGSSKVPLSLFAIALLVQSCSLLRFWQGTARQAQSTLPIPVLGCPLSARWVGAARPSVVSNLLFSCTVGGGRSFPGGLQPIP